VITGSIKMIAEGGGGQNLKLGEGAVISPNA